MRAVLVARDIAPSNAFKMVAEKIPGTKTFIGKGRALEVYDVEVASAVASAEVLLVGMSANANTAREEIMACQSAKAARVPYGLYADTFNCAHNRNWFETVRPDASFVFVLNDKDAREAKKVFPKAKIVALGNPLWDDFYFPKLSYEESRMKLGIMADETFVLVVGHKPSAITIPLWADVIEALNLPDVIDKRKWQIVFSRHPGDRVELDDKLHAFVKGFAVRCGLEEKYVEKQMTVFEEMSRIKSYQELVKWNDVSARVLTIGEMSASEMVPGCDILIGPASTTEIEAVCQRKPVISYLKATTNVRLRGVSGGKWELVEDGVTAYVGGEPEYLANRILDLLDPESDLSQELRARQEELYPVPKEKGVALLAIASTLQEFAKK